MFRFFQPSYLSFGLLIGTVPAILPAAPAQDAPAFAWPFSTLYNVTAGYDLDRNETARADWTGWRLGEATIGNGHAYDNHSGHDFGMATNTNLYAPARGRVNSLRESVPNGDHNDTGNYLILDHTAAYGNAVGGLDYRTRYWHLAQNGVIPAAGATVNKGAHIAYSDDTGNSTGPHLHYAIARLPADTQTCAFYHAWWENDEFYTVNTRPCLVYLQIANDTLNVREGASTSYNIITALRPNSQVVASQHNTWWRVFLPLPPGITHEARNSAGGLNSGYTEAGTWANWASKSAVSYEEGDPDAVTLSGMGSRTSTFTTTGNAADVATFSFTAPTQRGLYDVYATWPSNANALGVTYRVTHADGTTDVVVDQRGDFTGTANGSKAFPYVINQNPYIVNHTTVGAPDEWDLYMPQGSTLPQHGPENLYKFTLYKAATVTFTVDHAGYPTRDIDLHLLNAPSPSACIQRANWTLTASLAAGTYYLACDSYGTGTAGNNAACPYKLTVKFSEDHPFPNSWVKLGQFNYNSGGPVTVQVREQSVTGPAAVAQQGRVVADAIRLVPRITRRSGWISNAYATQINTASTPVACVVIKTDATANNDSNSMDNYAEVAIYRDPGSGTTNASPVVAKAVTGQRFVCVGRHGDWYQVHLTLGSTAEKGWLLGDHLVGYNINFDSRIDGWELY